MDGGCSRDGTVREELVSRATLHRKSRCFVMSVISILDIPVGSAFRSGVLGSSPSGQSEKSGSTRKDCSQNLVLQHRCLLCVSQSQHELPAFRGASVEDTADPLATVDVEVSLTLVSDVNAYGKSTRELDR